MQLSMAVKIELNAQTRAGLAEAEAGNEDEHHDGCVCAGKPAAIKTGDDDCSKIGFRCECSLNDCLAIF